MSDHDRLMKLMNDLFVLAVFDGEENLPTREILPCQRPLIILQSLFCFIL